MPPPCRWTDHNRIRVGWNYLFVGESDPERELDTVHQLCQVGLVVGVHHGNQGLVPSLAEPGRFLPGEGLLDNSVGAVQVGQLGGQEGWELGRRGW